MLFEIKNVSLHSEISNNQIVMKRNGKTFRNGTLVWFCGKYLLFFVLLFSSFTFILNVIKDMLLMKKQMHVYLLLLFLLVKIVER